MAGKLEVDTNGFKKRVAWRGPLGVLTELISNALDENITYCDVIFEQVDRQTYRIRVEDDSLEGFRNLDESFTLYADSRKAGILDKRGRFNFGEKVAIVLCDDARIESTTGTRIFLDREVKRSPRKREKGTVFEGTMRCTRAQYEDACAQVVKIISPDGIRLTFNGHQISRLRLVTMMTATLPTIGINDEGELFKTATKTDVAIYEPPAGASGAIYELGVPVVNVDHPFIMDVRQKVPLSVDRNNVTPGYYRKLCGAVLDATASLLTEEQARSKGVTEGIAAARNDEAIKAVIVKKHGDGAFVPDPGNREANGELFACGHHPVNPGTYDRETWDRIRGAHALPSSSDLIPRRSVPPVSYGGEVTHGMRQVAALAKLICDQVLHKSLRVQFSGNTNLSCSAQCGPRGWWIGRFDVSCQDSGSSLVQREAGAVPGKPRPDLPRTGASQGRSRLHEGALQPGDVDCCIGVGAAANEAGAVQQVQVGLILHLDDSTLIYCSPQTLLLTRPKTSCINGPPIALLSGNTNPRSQMSKNEPARRASDVTGLVGVVAGSDTSVKVTDTATGNTATAEATGRGHEATVEATQKATDKVDALQPKATEADDE